MRQENLAYQLSQASKDLEVSFEAHSKAVEVIEEYESKIVELLQQDGYSLADINRDSGLQHFYGMVDALSEKNLSNALEILRAFEDCVDALILVLSEKENLSTYSDAYKDLLNGLESDADGVLYAGRECVYLNLVEAQPSGVA